MAYIEPMDNPTQTDDATIAELVAKARKAQAEYAGYSQQQVDEVVTAVAWKIIEPSNNRRLSEQAVADTGFGRVADKVAKNHRKTIGLLRDLSRARSVGVVAENKVLGIIEIARPVGVVAAVVPSTNPVATPFNKALNALKGGNAVILAPSPRGEPVCGQAVKLMRDALAQVGAPRALAQKLPAPITKQATMALMRQADLVVVTGSQNNVRAAVGSGTPAIGVGAGNVAVIIDDSADIQDAADKIIASKTFDNATSCSSENSIVVLDSVYDAAMAALRARGAKLLSRQEKEKLRQTMWPQGKLSADIIAKSSDHILDRAGIARGGAATVIMVAEEKVAASNNFCDEKLSPVLTVFRAADFTGAMAMVAELYEINGKGHSVGVHSHNDENILRLGLELPVCRVIVNQAHCFATGGAFDNGLPFSLSMGCGSWGGNVISDNMNYRHYINTTRIARAIDKDEPEAAQLFGEFWKKHNIEPGAL